MTASFLLQACPRPSLGVEEKNVYDALAVLGIIMTAEDWGLKLSAFQQVIESLQQRTATWGRVDPQDSLSEVVQELSVSLEELHIAHEELYQQNEELQEARGAAEVDRQRYLELFDFAPDGYFVTNSEGVIQEANRAAAVMLNMPQHFLIGKPLLVFMAEVEHWSFHTRLSHLLAADVQVESWEVRVQPRQSPPFDAVLTVAVVSKVAGQVTGLRWLLRDITKHKQAEEALRRAHDELAVEVRERTAELTQVNLELRQKIAERERMEDALRQSEKRYRDLFEQANDAIITFTLHGIIISVNHATEQLLGWTREELIGQHYRLFATPAAVVLEEERIRQALVGEDLQGNYETEFACRDGRVVPVEGRARFLYDETGVLHGVEAIFRDISARKALEQQRADFIAILSHDIRSPLSVILGYAEMLYDEAKQRGAQDEEEMLQRLSSSALAIYALVTNYLDLSTIEAGQLKLAMLPVALNDLLGEVARQYEGEAQRRRITLAFHLEEELPLVTGDVVALRRVVVNLLHNALKFTPPQGQVTVSSIRRRAEVVVAVSDTGPGIATAEIPALFEKYRRAKKAQSIEGAGLGLFIVKTLVEAHGGWVEVQSGPGQGARFLVFLPAALAAVEKTKRRKGRKGKREAEEAANGKTSTGGNGTTEL